MNAGATLEFFSSAAVFSTLVLLAAGTAVAQPQPSGFGSDAHRIELTAETSRHAHEVQVSPGRTTAILFNDDAIQGDAVLLEGRERFSLVDAGNRSVLLVPSERVAPGDRLRLSVPFKDASAPATAVFVLVVDPTLAERQVEVFRHARTAESLRQELTEKEARLRQCGERVERLQSEQTQPGGLTGLLASGVMARSGVAGTRMTHTFIKLPGNALEVMAAWSYRATGRVAVELELANLKSTQPWTVEGAALANKVGEALRMVSVWQSKPATLDSPNARVVVEAEASEQEVRGPFTLKLWVAGGRRTVTLNNVTFP